MRRRAPLLLFVMALMATGLLIHQASRVSAAVLAVPTIYTAAAQYQPLAWLHGGERFPQGAQLYLDDGNTARLVAPGFAATADASLSPDATHILFAGRRTAGEAWQIWEMPVAGGEPSHRLCQTATGAICAGSSAH
jgi:hypothetical protein